MNWQYISGFFDADGSITLVKEKSSYQFKNPKIDFTNVELSTLQEIQKYILDNIGIKGSISTKPPRKENHKISYALSYSYNGALEVIKMINSFHPKKKHRISVCLKYYKQVVPRNGKHSIKQIFRRTAFERLFFKTLFS